jgi:hypothetical protein
MARRKKPEETDAECRWDRLESLRLAVASHASGSPLDITRRAEEFMAFLRASEPEPGTEPKPE